MSRSWESIFIVLVGIKYIPLFPPHIPSLLPLCRLPLYLFSISITRVLTLLIGKLGLRPPHSNPLRLHYRPTHSRFTRPLLPHRLLSNHQARPRICFLRTRRRYPLYNILFRPHPIPPQTFLGRRRRPRSKIAGDSAQLFKGKGGCIYLGYQGGQ